MGSDVGPGECGCIGSTADCRGGEHVDDEFIVKRSGRSVTVTVAQASANAAPQATGIANAASAAQADPGVVTPGSYVAIYGTGLAGSGNGVGNELPLPMTTERHAVVVGRDTDAASFAGAGQVNALVPQGIAPNASYPLVVVRGRRNRCR